MGIGVTAGLQKKTTCTAAIATAFTIAKFGATDEIMSVATAATEDLVGVFQHTTTTAGDEVRVMFGGITNLVLGGTVTRGDLVTTDSAAKGVAVTQHLHVENAAGSYTQSANTAVASVVRVLGRAMKSGVSGDIIPVHLIPGTA